jgi:hypothetical protein
MADEQYDIQQHDIDEETKLVEEEKDLAETEGEPPQRRSLTIPLILGIIAVAIAFFVVVTYLPGLFRH